MLNYTEILGALFFYMLFAVKSTTTALSPYRFIGASAVPIYPPSFLHNISTRMQIGGKYGELV
jgi:hypothetical protein